MSYLSFDICYLPFTIYVIADLHHYLVYLDNPDVVNKLLIKEMDKATGGNRMTIRMR